MKDEADRLEKSINRLIGESIAGYGMIQDGDRILVAVSGGKDSLCLLHFLESFRKKAPVHFELLAVNLDQGQPGFPEHILPELFASWEIPFHIEKEDTYSIVLEKTSPGQIYCAMCSRLRRGILYRIAREKNCNKIALGHHREDILQTFLLNAFFSGKMGTMPPVYRIQEGDLTVIRPLASVPEEKLREYAELKNWPIVPCNLCGSQEELKRKEMGLLLADLEKKYPQIKNSLFAALGNLHTEELLQRNLWADEFASPGKEKALFGQ